MNDYLNPKSMVTPGVAGGLIVLITNTCATQFHLERKWTALVLSAMIGLVVVIAFAGSIWEKAIFWVLNSLIIFSMAMGTNEAASDIASPSVSTASTPSHPTTTPKPAVRPTPLPERTFFRSWSGGRDS
jgi:hypothetical protein